MSISSVGQGGPTSPINTNAQVQNRQPQTQASGGSGTSSSSSNSAGAQPLNSSGRGQVVNLVV
jgi:hypothetical protein